MSVEAYKKKCGIVDYCVQDSLFGGVTRFITEAVPQNLHFMYREMLGR